MEKGYAHSVAGTGQDLERYARLLGDTSFWVADVETLQVGQGLPADWLDQGAVFSDVGELRWWRRAQDYEALLLTRQPMPGCQPLAGEWEAKEERVFLQNLGEPRVCPTFAHYPSGHPDGSLIVRVYRRDGIVSWISPCRFAAHNQEASA